MCRSSCPARRPRPEVPSRLLYPFREKSRSLRPRVRLPKPLGYEGIRGDGRWSAKDYVDDLHSIEPLEPPGDGIQRVERNGTVILIVGKPLDQRRKTRTFWLAAMRTDSTGRRNTLRWSGRVGRQSGWLVTQTGVLRCGLRGIRRSVAMSSDRGDGEGRPFYRRRGTRRLVASIVDFSTR